MVFGFFFFKQKTAYEITEGDWSSDVCSSDLHGQRDAGRVRGARSRPRADQHGRLRNERRSEERRVGKEWPQLCRSQWSPEHEKKKDKGGLRGGGSDGGREEEGGRGVR